MFIGILIECYAKFIETTADCCDIFMRYLKKKRKYEKFARKRENTKSDYRIMLSFRCSNETITIET